MKQALIKVISKINRPAATVLADTFIKELEKELSVNLTVEMLDALICRYKDSLSGVSIEKVRLNCDGAYGYHVKRAEITR